MPTSASVVGPVSFPLDATTPNTALRDPVATTLLHLAAHYMNDGMAAKLESMQPTAKEAVPTDDAGVPENLGEFDPGTTFVRRDLPALYCWNQKSVTEDYSTVKMLRTSEYHMRYYFQPLIVPQGRGARSGVLPDIDRLLHRMSFERRHLTFPSTAVAVELAKVGVIIAVGSSIEKALCLRELKLLRSVFGMTWESPGQSSTAEGISRSIGTNEDGAVQRGFPTLHAVWSVKAFVSGDTFSLPSDETPDLVLKIKGSTGEGEGHVDIMDRNLQAPDGTDSLNQKDEFE